MGARNHGGPVWITCGPARGTDVLPKWACSPAGLLIHEEWSGWLYLFGKWRKTQARVTCWALSQRKMLLRQSGSNNVIYVPQHPHPHNRWASIYGHDSMLKLHYCAAKHFFFFICSCSIGSSLIGCFLNILLKSKKGLSKPQFENQICRTSDALKSYYFSINVKSWDRGGDSISSRTTNLTVQTELRWSGFSLCTLCVWLTSRVKD